MVRKTLGKYGGNHYGRGLNGSRKRKQNGGENKKLVVTLTNGLSNRLFQIMVGLGFAERWNMDLYLLNSDGDHVSPEISKSDILELFPFVKFIDESTEFTSYTKVNELQQFVYTDIPNPNNDAILSGYFQTEKYFPKIPVKLNLVKPTTSLLEGVDVSKLIFIHFRYGDYNNNGYKLDLDSYYKICINKIKEQINDPIFFIVTNSKDEAKRYIETNLTEISNNSITYDNDSNETRIDSLYYMSQCKGGICTNSTFAWFGAYCIENKNKDLIFMPMPWLSWITGKNDIYPTWATPIDINQQVGGDNLYTAFIIEPRKHKALRFVLNNILENLDNRWNIIIFHGNLNKEYIENIINTSLEQYRDRISLQSLNIDDLSLYQYNNLLTSKEFYNNIPTEMFLVFQTDSMINPKNKDKIYDFINYDYVGAPWINQQNFFKDNLGNGGFSLRRKSKMLEIIDKVPYNGFAPEDVYFSLPPPNIQINKPTMEQGKKFSSEEAWDKESFGIHKVWNFVHNHDILYDEIPELKELIELQGVEIEGGGESIDIVITFHIKDAKILPYTIKGLENVTNKGSIYLITNEDPKIENTIYIDEKLFPFKKDDIIEYIGQENSNRAGWYFQQLLKLYVFKIIPNLSENFLIVDSETVFLNPVTFVEGDKLLFATGNEYNKPYFDHMKCLFKDQLVKQLSQKSGVVHHMIFSKKYLKQMLDTVQNINNSEPWMAFMECVNKTKAGGSEMSEYEIFFNFMLQYNPNNTKIRELRWIDVQYIKDYTNFKTVDQILSSSKNNYDYVTLHKWFLDNANIQGGNKETAYVINLDKRPEKWERIQNDFKDTNIHLERFKAIENENGHIGCGESFKALIRMAKEKNMDSILVLEDDCKLLKNFNSRWAKIKVWLDNNKDKWNIFNGGVRYPLNGNPKYDIDVNNKLFTCKGGNHTHFMYFNSKGYDAVLNWEFSKHNYFDYYINSYELGNFLYPEPAIAIQYSGFSNTNKGDKDYDTNMWVDEQKTKTKNLPNNNTLKGGRRKKKRTRKNKKQKGGENDKKEDERYCKYVSVYGILRSCKEMKNLYYLLLEDSINNFQIPSTPFVLVTHHGDATIPDSYINKSNEILNSPNLIHWFSQNLTKHDNPKLTPIPIGINYHSLYLQEAQNLWWGEGGVETPIEQEKYLESINDKPFYERELKVYINFIHEKREGKIHNSKSNKSDRVLALEQIPKDLIVIEENRVKRRITWGNMVKYVFSLSPLGNGLDCHRTWEILALGSIPIVKKSTNDPLYKDLPVLIVDEWSDINENLLKDTINKFKNTKFNMDKTTNKYWVDLIREKTNSEI